MKIRFHICQYCQHLVRKEFYKDTLYEIINQFFGVSSRMFTVRWTEILKSKVLQVYVFNLQNVH